MKGGVIIQSLQTCDVRYIVSIQSLFPLSLFNCKFDNVLSSSVHTLHSTSHGYAHRDQRRIARRNVTSNHCYCCHSYTLRQDKTYIQRKDTPAGFAGRSVKISAHDSTFFAHENTFDQVHQPDRCHVHLSVTEVTDKHIEVLTGSENACK